MNPIFALVSGIILLAVIIVGAYNSYKINNKNEQKTKK